MWGFVSKVRWEWDSSCIRMDVKRGEVLKEIRGSLLLYRMGFTRLPFSVSQHVSRILSSILLYRLPLLFSPFQFQVNDYYALDSI